MAGDAGRMFEEQVRPLQQRRDEAARELERIQRRREALLELAEERLIGKDEFVARRAELDAEQQALQARHEAIERRLDARPGAVVDIGSVLASLERLVDVFEALDDVRERRLLLQQCLRRVVVRAGALEVHVPANPVILAPDHAPEGSDRASRIPAGLDSVTFGALLETPETGILGPIFPVGFMARTRI
jgi:hypothetical protein